MLSTSLPQISNRLVAERRGLLVAVGVVLAAGAALLFGDPHSIGMTHD